MAVTVAQFRKQHPEFKTVDDDTVIQAFLDDAAKELLVADFITEAGIGDEYQRYLTADKITKSPYGKSSRLVNKDGRTTYQDSLDAIWLRALTGL